jgi:choline dehydrogenase-like flavoprotein
VGEHVYDFIVIGSGFGSSVSAMRLAEKGYRVLVLERWRRFRDEDFATTTWNLRRYLWAPAIGGRGILQISPFRPHHHGAGRVCHEPHPARGTRAGGLSPGACAHSG